MNSIQLMLLSRASYSCDSVTEVPDFAGGKEGPLPIYDASVSDAMK
jgi:hypothetical protein